MQTVQNGGINSPDGTGTFFLNFLYDVDGNPLDLNAITSIEISGEIVNLSRFGVFTLKVFDYSSKLQVVGYGNSSE